MMEDFSKKELEEALRAIASLIGKCEKVQLKLREGTPQASLISNRLKAFRISSSLISRALEGDETIGATTGNNPKTEIQGTTLRVSFPSGSCREEDQKLQHL